MIAPKYEMEITRRGDAAKIHQGREETQGKDEQQQEKGVSACSFLWDTEGGMVILCCRKSYRELAGKSDIW